ncbi:hypothetical protein [Paraburkholderia jirisanensis]
MKDGYAILPKADLDDATSVVVPLNSELWVKAEMDYQGDYVSVSELITVPDRGAFSEDH